MSRFTGPIRLEHMGIKWKSWKLIDPLIWEVDELGSGRIVTVPIGFETDGASVPRALWWLFPMTGKYLRAAALHDRLLALRAAGTPHEHAATKADIDRQFLIAMKACGVGLSRFVMWAAVRVFGK